jgi:hypothetical protein
MQYVLIRWIRDEQIQAQTRRGECKEQDRKQVHVVRFITTEWFERHPRALTTDTNGRKKTLSKSGAVY